MTQPDSEKLEALREEYESRLLAIEGVESVIVGRRENGTLGLLITTSIPVNQVRDRLPEELAQQPVSLEYRGRFGDQASILLEGGHQAIEQLRARYESALLEIEGVVFVTAGACESGKLCLLIGTSVPPDQVRPKLPEGLPETEIEIRYVGEPRIQ